MGSTTLVDDDIERGRKALGALREAGAQPRIALWRYGPESNEWRFTIALPALDHEGPRRVYERVGRILERSQIELPVWRISLLSTDDPIARWAKRRVRGATADVRSTGEVVNDTIVEDAYIYRSS